MPVTEVLDLDRLRRMVPAESTDSALQEYSQRKANRYYDVRIWGTDQLDTIRFDYYGIAADAWEDDVVRQVAAPASDPGDAGVVASKSTNGQSVSYVAGKTRADLRSDAIATSRKMAYSMRKRTRVRSVLVTERASKRFWDDDIVIPVQPDPGMLVTLAMMEAAFADHEGEANPHGQYELLADSPQVEFVQVAPSTHWGPIDWPYAEDPDAVVFDTNGVDVTARGVIVSRSGGSVFVDTTIPLAGKVYLRG